MELDRRRLYLTVEFLFGSYKADGMMHYCKLATPYEKTSTLISEELATKLLNEHCDGKAEEVLAEYKTVTVEELKLLKPDFLRVHGENKKKSKSNEPNKPRFKETYGGQLKLF